MIEPPSPGQNPAQDQNVDRFTDRRPTILERLAAVFITSLVFSIIYNGANYITALRVAAGEHIGTAAFSWERFIPFVPWMVVPYWSIDLFFICAPFVVATYRELRLLVIRMVIGVAAAGCFYLLFPLRLAFIRPPVEQPLSFLFQALDNFNNFYNLAPSLHIILRTVFWTVYIPAAPSFTRRPLQVWFFFVGVSTLLVYQHQVIDVFTGQLLGLLVIQVSRAFSLNGSHGRLKRRENARLDLAVKYLIGAGIFAGCTYLIGPAGILFLWPSAALLAVSTAYFGLGPVLFDKKEGRLASASAVLLYPYLIGRSISFLYFTRGIDPVVKISDSVFLGRRLCPDEEHLLPDGIGAVLDLTSEFSESPALLAKRYRNIQILDLTLPSIEQIRDGVDWIDQQSKIDGVYIHCSLGLSRSTLLAAAWLLQSRGAAGVDEAIARIRAVRPASVLHAWHQAALQAYAAKYLL